MQKPPLAGLNIVVTRPREQAEKLAQRIEEAGGKATLFPLLDISPVLDSQPLYSLIKRLPEFDLAIFISPNAVRYGMAAIMNADERKIGVSTEHHTALPATLQIATVGQGSARALHDYGITNVIAPQGRSDSESLLALPELQHIKGWHIAIFRGNNGREVLGNTLKSRGAKVEYVTCYQRTKPNQDITLLLSANPDAITVTSSEALHYLCDMMLDSMERKRLATLPLFVPHARIAETANNLGWSNIISTNDGDDGLISGLIAWAKKNVSSRTGHMP